MSELNEYTRTFADWLHIPQLALIAILLPLATIGVIWHIGSTYPLRACFWRLLVSKQDSSDGSVRQMVREREALVEFRYIFGIPARTLKDVERLQQWAVDTGQDLSAAAACGRYFDVAACTTRRPKLFTLIGLVVLTVTLHLSTLGCAELASKSAVLVSLKNSSQWFWLTTTEAVRTEPSQWYRTITEDVVEPRYLRDDCGVYRAARGLGTNDDLGMLCSGLLNPELSTFVQSSLNEQRVFFGSLCILLSWLLFLTIRSFLRALAANSLHKRSPADRRFPAVPPVPLRDRLRAIGNKFSRWRAN